jgi:hypothetical protein
MNRDQGDERLRALVGDYRLPPPTPREEIWAAIQPALAARRRPRRLWLAAVTGMAATFLIGLLVGGGALTGPPAGAAEGGAAFALVDAETGRHLARVEMLLRALRTEAASGVVPTGMATTARVLLAENRFLADLPPEDQLPEITRLLADIELVLAQIAVLEGGADREELRLIEEGIEIREVLPRLHHFALNL